MLYVVFCDVCGILWCSVVSCGICGDLVLCGILWCAVLCTVMSVVSVVSVVFCGTCVLRSVLRCLECPVMFCGTLRCLWNGVVSVV